MRRVVFDPHRPRRVHDRAERKGAPGPRALEQTSERVHPRRVDARVSIRASRRWCVFVRLPFTARHEHNTTEANPHSFSAATARPVAGWCSASPRSSHRARIGSRSGQTTLRLGGSVDVAAGARGRRRGVRVVLPRPRSSRRGRDGWSVRSAGGQQDVPRLVLLSGRGEAGSGAGRAGRARLGCGAHHRAIRRGSRRTSARTTCSTTCCAAKSSYRPVTYPNLSSTRTTSQTSLSPRSPMTGTWARSTS